MFFVINTRFFRNIFKPGGAPAPPGPPLGSRFADTAAAARHGHAAARGTAAAVRGTAAAASRQRAATENIFDVFDVLRRFEGL